MGKKQKEEVEKTLRGERGCEVEEEEKEMKLLVPHST